MFFLIATSVKAPSILHPVDSIVVLVGRLFTSSALNITVVEAPAIREVSLDNHYRFSIKELQYDKSALLVHMLSMH